MAGGRWGIRIGGGRRGTQSRGTTLGGRIVATLFFGFFLGMGLLFVALIGREAWRAAETFGWTERRCEITHAEVVRAGGEQPYQPRVRFHTLGAGERVSGDRIRRGGLSAGSHGGAAGHLAPYPVGATVPCYVSSAGEAVLERGPLWIGLWILLPLVFVAIGGGGLFVTWRPEKKDRFGRPLAPALGERATRRGSGRALVVAGLGVCAVGLVAAWFLAVAPFARVLVARSWVRTTCTVEHSSVVSHDSDDGTTYSVDILYRWDRGRGVERSSRYGFFGGSSSGYQGKAEIVRAHPVGAEVACWVDPERRNEAVLERGLTAGALLALIPLALLGGGVAMLVVGRRRRTRRARTRRQAATGQAPFREDDPVFDVLPDFETRPGPVALKPQSSPVLRLLGVIAVTLFWNGIVGVFVYQAWQGWARGRPDWFLTIFLVPFLLVGIGMVFGIFHAILALGNARPKLLIGSSAPRLGERVELQWRLSGGAGRIRRLRIALKGRERASYRVGTDTRTATEDFHEQTVVDLPAPVVVAGGQASFQLPIDAMHSFESRHNRIFWELELRGEIRLWPDVSETFPLVVLPASEDVKQEER